jgi:hypothetical protein
LSINIKSLLLIALAALSTTSCQTDPPELFPIFQNEKVGYVNRKGEVVVAPQFALGLPFSEGLALVCLRSDGGCGFIDQTGKIVIPTEFARATRFSEGLAAIKVADKVAYIDKTGKIVVNPQFPFKVDVTLYIFSEGLACVPLENNKFGFIDKTGKIAIPAEYEDVSPFFDGLAAVTVNKKAGFIDKHGRFVINLQFDGAEPFVNGLAAVKVGEKYGYIDKTGKIVISPQFDTAFPFSDEGLALVSTDQKIGFINRSGTYAISPQFVTSGWFFPFPWQFAFMLTPEIERVSFSEGLAPVKNKKDGKFGYINTTGNIVIDYQFDQAVPFYKGVAYVGRKQASEEEVALIDKQGKRVWGAVTSTANSNSTPSPH